MDNKIVEAIKKSVENQMNEWDFSDNLIYNGCVGAVEKINFCEILKSDVSAPIKTFLWNWGLMGRVLVRSYIPNDWESQIAGVIREKYDIFEKFRVSHLEDCDIEVFKSGIMDCYAVIRGIVRPTSAAKILHLLSCNFFPLWDVAIREKVNNDFKRKIGKIDVCREGYFNFMLAIQTLLKQYDKTLSMLSEKYNKPKLRILDMFLFDITRPKSKEKWFKISFT